MLANKSSLCSDPIRVRFKVCFDGRSSICLADERKKLQSSNQNDAQNIPVLIVVVA